MRLSLVEAVFVPPEMSHDTASISRSSGITTIMSFDAITTGRSSGSTTGISYYRFITGRSSSSATGNELRCYYQW